MVAAEAKDSHYRALVTAMAEVNDYRLSRNIDEDTKARIRKECSFGCVMCGLGVYDYAHLDPPFAQARVHDPARMALLCSNHHRALDKTKRLSLESVLAARENPKCKEDGFSRDILDCGSGEFSAILGGAWFFGCRVLLTAFGKDLLAIAPPEAPGAPNRLNALFCDRSGATTCEIVNNEIRAMADNWDVVAEGDTLQIRSGPRQIALELITLPGVGIRVERLDMYYAGARIVCKNRTLTVTGRAESTLIISESMFQDVSCCIDVQPEGIYQGGKAPPYPAIGQWLSVPRGLPG